MIAFISNNLYQIIPKWVLIVLVIIECFVHIRTSTLSPVRRKKRKKKSVSVCSVSEQSSSNQDRVEVGLMCTKACPYLIMIGGDRPLPVTYKK